MTRIRQQQRLEQFQADAIQAQEALDRLSAQLVDVSRQKTGKEAAEAVQQRLRDFIRNADDLGARKDFNAWFASTGLVFLVHPEMSKLEPKWAITLGTGSIETKGRQRRLVGFQASEENLSWMQGDTFEPEPVAAVFLYTQTRGLTGKLPFQGSATDRPPPQIC